MEWKELKSVSQLDELTKESYERPVIIFKHSTRCSISRATLDRMERNWKSDEMENITPYFLDLINFRDVSNLIADQFAVMHESPQLLIIEKGKSIFDASHMAIDYRQVRDLVKN